MKKIIFLALMSLSVASVLSLAVVSGSASAQVSSGINAATTNEMKNKQIDGNNGVIRTVSNILIWVVGIVLVIMIMWSGFKYITAAGDTSKVASAKNSLIYAIVGLIIAILAYAIVNFVIEHLGASSAGKSSGGAAGFHTEVRGKTEADKKREEEERRREEEERRVEAIKREEAARRKEAARRREAEEKARGMK